MASERTSDNASELQNDEEWLVWRAKQSLKNDPYAAKAWLLTARTLFPKSFKIQYEAYCIEKNAKNINEVSKILEDMFRNFPQEIQLWQEVKSYSEALQSEATDERTTFLKSVFAAFPATLQYHMLVNVAETTQDVLQQCRLMLLILDRYPEQVPDQGVKLIDQLLATEKLHQPPSPVNCYRKYLVCHAIPQVLKSCPPTSSKHLYRWLQKAIEFYLCYITQPPPPDGSPNTDLQSPTGQRSFSSMTSRMIIPGLSEKESYVEKPWQQLFDLLHSIGKLLEWNMTGLFGSSNCGSQWQVLHSVWEGIDDHGESTNHTKQILYCSLVLFLHCLYKYSCQTDSTQFTVAMPSNVVVTPVVLVEALKVENVSIAEPKAKKTKLESAAPELTASASINNAPELIDIFLTALKCWELLHSAEVLNKDFTKLLQHWKSESWSWLREFEIDVLIYQGFFKEALAKLQQKQPQKTPTNNRKELQIACCHYCSRSYSQACDHVMRVVSNLPLSSDSRTSLPGGINTGSRQLLLLSCTESEVLPYCIKLLITCFKEKAFGTSMPDDMSLGHMIVLMQYDWAKYERLFCDILHRIQHQGNFTYNLFFNYVINIDILEEFAYLKTLEGGKINLDILPTSTKQIAQTRTVTRGVNKGVKEDFRAALEKQVARSNENVESIIRHFFVEEKDLLQQHLM